MKLHAEVSTVDSRQVCWFSKVGSRYNLRCGQQNSGRHILGATICRQHIIASLGHWLPDDMCTNDFCLDGA